MADRSLERDLGSTASGVDANVLAAVAYLIGWASGAALLFFDQDNRFVKFHALQSVIVFGGLSVAWTIALSVPPFGWLVAVFVIPPVSAVLWLVLMYKAYRGEHFALPGAGRLAEQAMGR